MNPEPPAALQGAIQRELDGVSRNALAARAARISAQYRGGAASGRAIADEQDALAYALARLPATYAACAAVFAEARRLAPDFAPVRLLDAGAGPGGASWAALETWPGLASIVLLDAHPAFLALAARLAGDGPAALRGADVRGADLVASAAHPGADLVVASYALAEIAPERQGQVTAELWAASEGLLALVEPGTPDGFARMRAARDLLIAQGARVLAPCPHEAPCPMAGADWCHFVQRLPRRRDHRLLKGGEAPFEDEKFAYVVAARPGVAAAARTPRVLAPPRAAKPGIDLKLCGPGGLERRFVARRDKAAHARARRLGWGDALEPDQGAAPAEASRTD